MDRKREVDGGRDRPAVIVCDADLVEVSRMRRLLSRRYRLVLSRVAMGALNDVLAGSFQAMVLALREEDQSFLHLIPLVKKLQPRLPIIVVGDGRSLDQQRSAQRQGIFYFLPRPVGTREMRTALANAVEWGSR